MVIGFWLKKATHRGSGYARLGLVLVVAIQSSSLAHAEVLDCHAVLTGQPSAQILQFPSHPKANDIKSTRESAQLSSAQLKHASYEFWQGLGRHEAKSLRDLEGYPDSPPSFDGLPEYRGTKKPSLFADKKPKAFDLWWDMGSNLKKGESLAAGHADSYKKVGPVELISFIAGSGQVGPQNIGPILLGRIQVESGVYQPVLVYLLAASKDSVAVSSEPASGVIRTQAGDLVLEFLSASVIDPDVAFYGIQELAPGLYGMITELPPPGLPLLNGGGKYATLETTQQLFGQFDTLFNLDYTLVPDLSQLNPYILKSGKMIYLPSDRPQFSSNSTQDITRIAIRDEIKSLSNLGVKLLKDGSPEQTEDIVISNWRNLINKHEVAYELINFVEHTLVAKPEINDRDLVERLLVGHVSRDAMLWFVQQKLNKLSAASTEQVIALKRLQRVLSGMRSVGASELIGPSRPMIVNGKLSKFVYLQVGQTVVLSTSNAGENSGHSVSSRSISSRSISIGEVRKIFKTGDVRDNYLRLQIYVSWKDGREVSQLLTVSADELMTGKNLHSYVFSKSEAEGAVIDAWLQQQ